MFDPVQNLVVVPHFESFRLRIIIINMDVGCVGFASEIHLLAHSFLSQCVQKVRQDTHVFVNGVMQHVCAYKTLLEDSALQQSRQQARIPLSDYFVPSQAYNLFNSYPFPVPGFPPLDASALPTTTCLPLETSREPGEQLKTSTQHTRHEVVLNEMTPVAASKRSFRSLFTSEGPKERYDLKRASVQRNPPTCGSSLRIPSQSPSRCVPQPPSVQSVNTHVPLGPRFSRSSEMKETGLREGERSHPTGI